MRAWNSSYNYYYLVWSSCEWVKNKAVHLLRKERRALSHQRPVTAVVNQTGLPSSLSRVPIFTLSPSPTFKYGSVPLPALPNFKPTKQNHDVQSMSSMNKHAEVMQPSGGLNQALINKMSNEEMIICMLKCKWQRDTDNVEETFYGSPC